MTDNFLARQVKRFDGTGYQSWKFQITAVLMANDIFDVVDGTRVKSANQQGDNGAFSRKPGFATTQRRWRLSPQQWRTLSSKVC
ncbi:unnamed protein product [Lasius platythorax]|uniref:Uncharacterized protein n=1 Tax=Lasius platythorax TaxID=488582 RepID=A0AAV2NLX7_9HYME